MSITNLQQARQMYAMGQRVAKTLDGSRPGYRGDNAYGPSSRSNQATSIGQARSSNKSSNNNNNNNTPQHSPHTRSGYTGPTNYGPQQPPQQFIGGKSYNVTPETRGDRDRATALARTKQQIMNQTKLGGNRIDKYGNTRKSPFRQGGGLGSLLMGALGMFMGIPGLGLLTGGFKNLQGGLGSLNRKMRGVNPDGTTRTQAQYEQARYNRQQQKRLDKLFAAKDRGFNQIGFGDFTKKTMDFTPGQQAKIDQLMAAGYMPSTARNVDSGRGSDLRGILSSDNLDLNKLEASDLNNISSLIAATDQGELEVPGDNLPVLSASPNRNINYNRIQGYTDEYPNLGMEEVVESNTIPTINGVPMINTGSVYDNLNKNPYTYPADTIVQNTVPVSNYDVRDDFYTGDRLSEFEMENGVITKNDQRLVAPFRLANGGIASL